MNAKLKKVLAILIVSAILSTVMAYAAPGDNNDPLVTLSYITDVLMPELESQISRKVESEVKSAMSDVEAGTGASSDGFALVNINSDYSIIGDEGTEIVVRSGAGKIVATSQGGVADLTAGVDLADSTDVPLNHHLLIPRSDKRGIKFSSDAIVLVKGTYSVSRN